VFLDGATTWQLCERALAVAFVGAILGLDNIAVGQFMLAQPAVGAVLVGFLVHEPLAGVWAALTFQLLWAGQLPVGAYVPPNAAIMAIAAVGMAAPAPVPFPLRVVAAAALAVPVGIAAGKLDVWAKTRNVAVLHRAEKDLLDGRPFALGAALMKGAAHFFLKDFFLLLVAVFAGGYALTLALPHLGAAADKAAAAAFAVSPAVGLGVALRTYWNRRHAAAFAGGAVAAALAMLILVTAL